jgi:23S rRNA (pseudouridine1915-N3)-methyltransferase
MCLGNMQIRIVAVGKLKEKYWKDALAEYQKRLSPYTRLEITEVAEERMQDNPSAAEIEQCLEKEGDRILKYIPPSFYVIPLAIEGQRPNSGELASLLGRLVLAGKSQLAFIIGGSHGLAPAVLRRGDFLLSFSSLTFPHQMMRVMLAEQLYRAYSILNGGKYHK